MIKKVFFLLVLIILNTSIVSAAENSIWVESDGEAYLSEIDTPKEVIERAKRDAQSVEDEAKRVNINQTPSITPDIDKLKGKFYLK